MRRFTSFCRDIGKVRRPVRETHTVLGISREFESNVAAMRGSTSFALALNLANGAKVVGELCDVFVGDARTKMPNVHFHRVQDTAVQGLFAASTLSGWVHRMGRGHHDWRACKIATVASLCNETWCIDFVSVLAAGDGVSAAVDRRKGVLREGVRFPVERDEHAIQLWLASVAHDRVSSALWIRRFHWRLHERHLRQEVGLHP